MVGVEEGKADALQLRPVHDLRGGRHPFSRSLGNGFGEEGKGKGDAGDLQGGFDDGKIGRRDSEIADHPFGHPLVEGEGQDQGVGEGVRDVVGIEEGRHLGLAAEALQPLGDVEDEIPPVSGDETLGQCPDVADPLRLVAQFSQGPLDRGDRQGGGRIPRFLPLCNLRRDSHPEGRTSCRFSSMDDAFRRAVRITENLARVVSKEQVAVLHPFDILGQEGNLAAAPPGRR